MTLHCSLIAALTAPSSEGLWQLRADLLQTGVPAQARVLAVVGELRRFLDALATGTSSRSFSDLASKMDVAALGGVVLEEALEADDGGELARRLLAGMVTEGLAVWATRQHVKAWEGELAAVYREATWWLYGELWEWACRRRPELKAEQRRLLLDQLLAPAVSPTTPAAAKVVIIGRLFQVLLLDAAADALAVRPPS